MKIGLCQERLIRERFQSRMTNTFKFYNLLQEVDTFYGKQDINQKKHFSDKKLRDIVANYLDKTTEMINKLNIDSLKMVLMFMQGTIEDKDTSIKFEQKVEEIQSKSEIFKPKENFEIGRGLKELSFVRDMQDFISELTAVKINFKGLKKKRNLSSKDGKKFEEKKRKKIMKIQKEDFEEEVEQVIKIPIPVLRKCLKIKQESYPQRQIPTKHTKVKFLS